MVEALVFYIFATILLISSFLVITAKNQVYAVLFLILAFFNAAGLFILLGAEFLAMILVVVYVGAVAVLFLFVVMMLNVKIETMKRGFVKYVPIGALIGVTLLVEMFLLYRSWKFAPSAMSNRVATTPDISNTDALGRIIYTDNIYLFQIAGLILLVAMIGAIVLTLRTRPEVRKQNISNQVSRNTKDVIEIVHVETGKGVK